MPQTRQLTLREFRDEDAPVLYELMRDATAMRYTYVAPSLHHCANRLQQYEAMRISHGFAPWVALNRFGHIVGWGGLSIDPEAPEWGLEVIYAFEPASWGMGYATELVRFSVASAFEQLSAVEVGAFVMPENGASIRVLAKCGFRLVRYEPTLQRNRYLAVPASDSNGSGRKPPVAKRPGADTRTL